MKIEIAIAIAAFLLITWGTDCHGRLALPSNTSYTNDILRLSKAAHIKAYLSEDQFKPCENFYKFACGNWPRLHPARTHNVNTHYLNELQELYVRKSSEMLKALPNSVDTSADHLLKNFFTSCRVQANDTKSQLSAILQLTDLRGGWPEIRVPSWYHYEYDWLLVVATIKQRTGLDVFFGVDIIPDYKEQYMHRLKVGAPKLPLGNRNHYLDTEHEDMRNRYERTIMEKLKTYFPEQRNKWVEEVASQVIHIEQQLAKGLPHNAELTLEQTTRHRTAADLNAAYGSYVDVSRFLNIIFNDTIYLELYESPEDYLSNLVDVIRLTPKLTLANYTIWRVLDFFDGTARVPHRYQPDTWCVHKVNEFFPQQLESLFHRNYNNMQMINEVQSTWADVKRVFRESLQASEGLNWLTLETRQKAINKLEALDLQFPTFDDRQLIRQMHGLVLKSDQFYNNLLIVLQWQTQQRLSKLLTVPQSEQSAYILPQYKLMQNKIQVPITFLQSRFFWDASYPNALKYGTLGALLAQQMIQGFDDLGRRYDRHGYQNNWWDRTSEDSYLRHSQCFEEPYRRFFDTKKTNTQDTVLLRKAVADNGALNVAYRAYQKWLKNSAESTTIYQRETLPALPYTHNQLFYIAYAQLWCSDSAKTLDKHPKITEEARVNIVLSNSQSFANTFSCLPDDNLNARFKCKVY